MNHSPTICIIPARGGSKRLPGKNIKDFLGKPLLAWTIETAKASGVFDRIILMTDDEKIAEVGKRYGAEVPFMEPEEFGQDNVYVAEPLKYTLKRLKEEENFSPDFFMLLEPSCPGRLPRHIKEVVEIFKNSDADSIAAVSEIPTRFNSAKSLKIFGENELRHFSGTLIKDLTHQNQKIEKLYYINSAIYAFKTKNLFEENNSLWGKKVIAYMMDPKYALDIDTFEDWENAEIKTKKLLEEKES